ncbi:Aldo/keto reductase [Morchella conica CCBAS932]|uniref:Aldo/keto reductase n=1 Tax=Morchella conica CCBAS932 TaxID=1392247 RepID=A0A3N4L3I1_9PEZI|nr:Aldo/keto reductase [Morchella conica CCBAS932]
MTLLPTRPLGRNGPQVTALGLGLMGLSAFYGKVDSDEERFKFLDRAHELGERFWDTSDFYGDNEELIGKWFKKTGKRKDIFIASKFAATTDTSGESEGARYGVRGDKEYVHEAYQNSSAKLGVDYIDLYYIHRIDRNVPIEETMEALAELVKAGKIGHIGISECSAATLRRAHAVHPIAALQVEYSPFTLEIEGPPINLLSTARELGITTVAYSPLGRGMLTGAYKSPDDFEEGDLRKYLPRYSKENFPKNLELVEKFRQIADRKKCTPGQLALAWLMAQGEDIIPIPGTKKTKYLEENVGALNVELTTEEVKEIREATEAAEPAGERVPAGFAHGLYGDTPERR